MAASAALASERRAQRRLCTSPAGWPCSGWPLPALSAGTRRGRSANGRARTRSASSSFFSQRHRARRSRPGQGAVPLDQCAGASPPRQCAAQGTREHRGSLRPRQRLLRRLARPDDDLLLARVFASADDSLEAAQLYKIHTLLDRLDLKPGQRLLEIGCGWGTLAIEAAKRGAEVVGLTLSTEQKAWAERKIAEPGLSDRIEIRLQDYRDIAEHFDAIASVEMVEAVGQRWWGAYFDCIARNLKPGGAAALQFISMITACSTATPATPTSSRPTSSPAGCCSTSPSSRLSPPSAGSSGGTARVSATIMRRPCAAGVTATTPLWRPAGCRLRREFHDLWRYYLMYCEGGFRGGAIDVAQVTLTKLATSS